MGLVSNTAFNGDFSKNPFNFQHYDLSYLCVLDGNRMIPSKPFQPKFDHSKNYSRSYMSLFTDLGRYHKDQDINISYNEYKDGYTLFAVDLTPDLSADGMHTSILRNGNLTIDIKFSKALTETVNLLVYAEYRNTTEIDKIRSIFLIFKWIELHCVDLHVVIFSSVQHLEEYMLLTSYRKDVMGIKLL
ncbi:uncharacterized protein F54H12.2 [Nephila pilipes]|uniref:Uncharacterized protein F54H12.2 n=1 Tax=Nephila pilipes TaxID=299642 RepID=A0A8X6QXT7_NEPPI|nr:uncharacterized protein F54H12.2 [Nephila pilipes]